jgi:glycosyltransferase involved in cell wall biosynthesis
LEVGGESHGQGVPRSYDGSRPLRLVWSGQHIGRKALPLLLRAIASLNGRLGAQLTVLGDGPECAGWRSLADQLGIGALVRWTGRVPRDEALRAMAGADAFCSTSVLEETSLVVLEALSLGLPVLCHDACGMSVAVNETCGIKVPMRDPAASVEGFARAIERLSEQPAELRRLSAGALRRASELSWDSKAEHMARTYSRVALGVATGNGGTR